MSLFVGPPVFNGFFAWLGRQWLKAGRSKRFYQKNDTQRNPSLGPLDVFVQSVELSVDSLIAARKAVSLMLANLSPINPKDVLWDVTRVGPAEYDRTQYKVAILRKDHPLLADKGWTQAETTEGGVFTFYAENHLISLGWKFAKAILFGLLLYLAALFCISAWNQKMQKDISVLNQETRILAQIQKERQTEILILQKQISLLEGAISQTSLTHLIANLNIIGASQDAESKIENLSIKPEKISLTGFTVDPVTVNEHLSNQLTGYQVNLDRVREDRATGLQWYMVSAIPLKAPQ